MTLKNFFKFLSQIKDECDCEDGKQPTWLTLALAILPAILPVIFDKLGDILTRWLFDEDEDEEKEEDEDEEKEEDK